MTSGLFECVVNISEGQNLALLTELDGQAGESLRDRHSDAFHNRSVFTLINEPEPLLNDVRNLLHGAYQRLDLIGHVGVHPRFGVVDVVPFVALEEDDFPVAVALRDQLAGEISQSEGVSIFLYGPTKDGGFRTLPEVRKTAMKSLRPDFGPAIPDDHKGASAFGARPILVAWNLWLSRLRLQEAKAIASAVRTDLVRTLAFQVGEDVQISCNFISPLEVTPEYAYQRVVDLLPEGAVVQKAELVGLAPAAMLELISPEKWKVLGLGPSTTIESRL